MPRPTVRHSCSPSHRARLVAGRIRVASLLGCLALFGCEESDGETGPEDADSSGAEDAGSVDIEGGVLGTSLPESTRGFVHHRLANTQLNGSDPALDFYFGSTRRIADWCPDIASTDDVAEPYLAFTVHAQAFEVGTYDICTDFRCEGPRVEASGTFGGWQDPSLGGVDPTGGVVEIASIDDERVSGSFTLEFEDDVVTGEFELGISCVDDRS